METRPGAAAEAGCPTSPGRAAVGPHAGPRLHPSSTRYDLALPGGDDRGVAGPTARPAPTAPPGRRSAGPGGVAPAGGGSEVATADGGPEPASRPTLRELVERERWRHDATGALIPRPAADIAYRLSAWYGVQDVSVEQIIRLLLVGSR